MRECPIHKVQCGLWSLSQHVPCYQSLQCSPELFLSFALASGRPPQLLLGFAPLRNWPPKLSFCFVLPLGQPPKLFYLHSWSFCVCFRFVGVGGCGLLVEEGEGREAQTLYNQVFVLYLEKRHFFFIIKHFFQELLIKMCPLCRFTAMSREIHVSEWYSGYTVFT